MTVGFPVRRMDFDFTQVPRDWFGGDILMTHVVNGLNFVFPAGERFFIRSVRRYEDQLDDALRARVRSFYGQEAQHQKAHLHAFEMLEAQGYEIRSFLKWYERVAYKQLEPRVPAILRLSTTVALEHFTAVMGAWALDTDELDPAHDTMAELLRWHAAEEIEHKSVAFDVLQAVNPSYAVRVAGFGIAMAVLALFWTVGVRHLMKQERLDRKTRRAARRKLLMDHLRLARSAAVYLKPGFHPDQIEDRHLAENYLAGIGRLAA